MTKTKWAIVCLMGVFLLSPAARADFSLTDPGVTGSGSGVSFGTAVIASGGDYWIPHYGFFNEQEITSDTVADIYQESDVEAWDGTASVSTSGNLTNTQDVNGDTVTVTTNGSTSAATQRDDDAEESYNYSYAGIGATGGTGAVAKRCDHRNGPHGSIRGG